MANPVQLVKLALLFFASIFGAIIGGRDVAVALRETEPTRIEIEDFTRSYQGQQWLEVSGQLAREHAQLQESTHSVHRGKGLGYVYVPVVPHDWRPDEAVAVIATFGPVDMATPLDWDALCPREPCVSGQVRPIPLDHLDRRFPGLHVVETLVVVNVGTEPSPPLMMGGFTLLMVLTALGSGAALRRESFERRAGGSASGAGLTGLKPSGQRTDHLANGDSAKSP